MITHSNQQRKCKSQIIVPPRPRKIDSTPPQTQPAPSNKPGTPYANEMALTPAQAMFLERLNTEFTKEKVIAELHRRSVQPRIQMVSRWAMITRKMKHVEPQHDVPQDFTPLIEKLCKFLRIVELLPDCLSNVVLLLSSTHGKEAEMAAKVLWNVAWGAEYKAACVSAGAVPALVRLLSSSKGAEAEKAVGALINIADGDAACKASVIPVLVSLLSSSKGAEAEWAALALWGIAAGDAACKAACMSAGAVPALVSLLSSSKGREAEWAAKALTALGVGLGS